MGLSEKDKRWNQFIDEVCYMEDDELTEIQRKAALCFWYDSEMNSGGHCGYFDCYPDTDPKELISAIEEIAYKEIADNYVKALNDGEDDDWEETDAIFYQFEPSLCDCLQEYVEKNRDIIFVQQAEADNDLSKKGLVGKLFSKLKG